MNPVLILIVSTVISFLGGTYVGHNYTQNYWEAKSSKEKSDREEAITKAVAEEAARGAAAVSALFKQLQEEQAKNSGYQAQARALFANPSVNGSSCTVTYGFIRLWNDSATGASSQATSTDELASTVDLATVLTATIENHGKYRNAQHQIDAIKASE